ncbi:MAG TPA: thermonuclease family protein [Ignavibacteria bacterium]|nr:thermonuclease family protein [Ignavibacteria bacterium]
MIKLAFKSVKFLLLVAVISAAGYFYVLPKLESAKQEKIETEKQIQTNEYLFVTKVIDGDTFKMSNGEKVRLTGIDTPEKFESDKLDRQSGQSGRDKETIKKLGEASSEYVRKLVEGKKVTMVKDQGYDDRDKYGRLLRYIYLEDGTFVNAKILEDGYANVYYSKQISKMDEFKKLERDARENKRGLWGEVDGLK